MSHYQIIARKYRPKLFKQVLDQDAIVTTLKNSLKNNRLSHAYLFCGSKGTGKTTLARIFAKALNCGQRTDEQEPCNECASCKEIMTGSSLDVLEIDGASHRGIEDIRQLNENLSYVPRQGNYKIYLIDEVHMLTKEAFNALLKSLEEPPAHVKFFFATTEPHKLPTTILSRCQRFQLNRISKENIIAKLTHESQDLKRKVDHEALELIAHFSEGGLRDAEVLLDQVLAFCDEDQVLTKEAVSDILGLQSKDLFFRLDEAGKNHNFLAAFEIALDTFSKGKNISFFIEELIEHFRTHLLLKIKFNAFDLSKDLIERYKKTSSYYSHEQCLFILDLLLNAQQQIKIAPFKRAALEVLLLKIVRSHQRVFLDALVERLDAIEKNLHDSPSSSHFPANGPKVELKGEISEDPSPQNHEIPKQKVQQEDKRKASPITDLKRKSRHDTLMRFASKELSGNLKVK